MPRSATIMRKNYQQKLLHEIMSYNIMLRKSVRIIGILAYPKTHILIAVIYITAFILVFLSIHKKKIGPL